MFFSSLRQQLVLAVLFSSVFVVSLSANAAVQSKTEASSLPVDIENIYSITIDSGSAKGSNNYVLKVFDDDSESREVARVARPLNGQVIDVEIVDIDDDGVDELVVMMIENVSLSTKVHFDVFEFDGKQLDWIDDFAPVSRLFHLFEKSSDDE